MCFRCGRTQYWHPDGSCHSFVPKREENAKVTDAGDTPHLFIGGPYHGHNRYVLRGASCLRVVRPQIQPITWEHPDSPAPQSPILDPIIYERYRGALGGPDYFIMKEK